MAVTPIQKDTSILRPRARIIKTIGEELISDDKVALLELVKNSYDADSSIITIKISGRVVVEKDGKNETKKSLKKVEVLLFMMTVLECPWTRLKRPGWSLQPSRKN